VPEAHDGGGDLLEMDTRPVAHEHAQPIDVLRFHHAYRVSRLEAA